MGNRQKEERLPLWFVCAFICKPCENTLVGYTNYIDYTWLWCITMQCGVEWVNVVYNHKLVILSDHKKKHRNRSSPIVWPYYLGIRSSYFRDRLIETFNWIYSAHFSMYLYGR